MANVPRDGDDEMNESVSRVGAHDDRILRIEAESAASVAFDMWEAEAFLWVERKRWRMMRRCGGVF